MKNILKLFTKKRKKLNPERPDDRDLIIKKAVHRTIKEYGKALKKLGAE